MSSNPFQPSDWVRIVLLVTLGVVALAGIGARYEVQRAADPMYACRVACTSGNGASVARVSDGQCICNVLRPAEVETE